MDYEHDPNQMVPLDLENVDQYTTPPGNRRYASGHSAEQINSPYYNGNQGSRMPYNPNYARSNFQGSYSIDAHLPSDPFNASPQDNRSPPFNGSYNSLALPMASNTSGQTQNTAPTNGSSFPNQHYQVSYSQPGSVLSLTSNSMNAASQAPYSSEASTTSRELDHDQQKLFEHWQQTFLLPKINAFAYSIGARPDAVHALIRPPSNSMQAIDDAGHFIEPQARMQQGQSQTSLPRCGVHTHSTRDGIRRRGSSLSHGGGSSRTNNGAISKKRGSNGKNTARKKRCQETDDRSKLHRDEERPLQCIRSCGAKFSSGKNWRRHLKESAQPKKHLCLVDHVNFNTNMCIVCEYPNPNADHVRSHLTELPNSDRCSREFQRPSQLRQHLTSIHKNLSDAEKQKYVEKCEMGVQEVGSGFSKCCGFCGKDFSGISLRNRFKHLKSGFENKKLCMRDWSEGKAHGNHTHNPENACDTVESFVPSDTNHSNTHDQDSGDDYSGDDGDTDGTDGNTEEDEAGSSSRGNENIQHSPMGGKSRQTHTTPSRQFSTRSRGPSVALRPHSHRTILERPLPSQGDFTMQEMHSPGSGPPADYGAPVMRCDGTSYNWYDEPIGPQTEQFKLRSRRNPQIQPPQRQGDATVSREADASAEHIRDKVCNQSPSGGTLPLTGRDVRDRSISTLGPDTFVIVQTLGEGAFAKVDEVFHIATGVRLARKTVKSNKRSSLDQLILEAKILRSLRHNHIIALIGTSINSVVPSIFLAPVAETTLAAYLPTITREDTPGKKRLSRWFGCLVSAVLHVHQSYYIHGDIKPSNILVTNEEEPNILLCDFGASQLKHKSKGDFVKSRVFTWQYCAPETIKLGIRASISDVFSLGCVFLEMAVAMRASTDELQDFRKEFNREKAYHLGLPMISAWIKRLRCGATIEETQILRNITSMLEHYQRRPPASKLINMFRPGACCIAWPNAQITSISSFQALHALARIKEVLRAGKGSHYASHGDGALIVNVFNPRTFSPRAQSVNKAFLETVLGDSTRADEFVRELIKEWVKKCWSSHTNCTRSWNQGSTPTWLLDIGGDDSSAQRVRLIPGSCDLGKVRPYAALGHCWCSTISPKLMLTKATCPTLVGGISAKSLPKRALQDIKLIRQLGIRYLWVESLCILHDANGDQMVGVSEMAEIYKNSFLTLSAVSMGHSDMETGPDGNEMATTYSSFSDHNSPRLNTTDLLAGVGACFEQTLEGNERSDQRSRNNRFGTVNFEAMSEGMALRKSRPLAQSSSFPQFDHNLPTAHAICRCRRTASLQGRLLSTRVLYYSQVGIWFECGTIRASRTFPEGLPPLLWESVHRLWKFSNNHQEHQVEGRSDNYEHYDLWGFLVEAISGKTFQSMEEKLHVITSLEKSIGSITDDEFVCGLGVKSLNWTLLWRTKGYSPSFRRTTEFPSWSWICMTDCEIEMPRYASGAPLSNVISYPRRQEALYLQLFGPVSHVLLEINYDGPSHRVRVPLRAVGSWVDSAAYLDCIPDTLDYNTTYPVLWLWKQSVTGKAEMESCIEGLLLRKEEMDHSYERLGVCSATPQVKSEDWEQNWTFEDIDYEHKEISIC